MVQLPVREMHSVTERTSLDVTQNYPLRRMFFS